MNRIYCGGRTSVFDKVVEINTDSIFINQKKMLLNQFAQKYIDSSYIPNMPSQESLDVCYIILSHKAEKEEKHNLQLLQKKLFAYFHGMPQNSSKYMLPEMLFSWKRFKELGLMNEMFYPMKILKNGLRIF